MEVRRYEDPRQFDAHAGSFLGAREAEHNLILGIVATLLADPGHYPDPPYLALVCEGLEVVAAAVRTPPFNVVVSMGPRDAMGLLADDVRNVSGTVPGVHGPAGNSRAFAEAWKDVTGAAIQDGIAQRIYRLDAVTPPAGVRGELRRATTEDWDLLLHWIVAFNEEALGQMGPHSAEHVVDAFLGSASRALYLWHDREPAAMAGYAGPTPNGMRVTAVYTPPRFRRRGYASAVVAGVSRLILESGRQYCFLYTDLSNPTTNHIYQNIGYRPVIDVSEFTFVDPTEPG